MTDHTKAIAEARRAGSVGTGLPGHLKGVPGAHAAYNRAAGVQDAATGIMSGYVAGKNAARARRDMSKWWNQPAYSVLPGGMLGAWKLIFWLLPLFGAVYALIEAAQLSESGRHALTIALAAGVIFATVDVASRRRESALPALLRWPGRLLAGVLGGGCLAFAGLLASEAAGRPNTGGPVAFEIVFAGITGLVLVLLWPGRRWLMATVYVLCLLAGYFVLGDS
ncbi:hypothetical protein [Salipiger abyssi]|nr:hypothetical protein [Salipiger abyssi]